VIFLYTLLVAAFLMPVVDRRQVTFLLLAQKKVTKEKGPRVSSAIADTLGLNFHAALAELANKHRLLRQRLVLSAWKSIPRRQQTGFIPSIYSMPLLVDHPLETPPSQFREIRMIRAAV